MRALLIFIVLLLVAGPAFADILLSSQIPAELQRDMQHMQNGIVNQFWEFTAVFKVYGLIVAALCAILWAGFTGAALRVKK